MHNFFLDRRCKKPYPITQKGAHPQWLTADCRLTLQLLISRSASQKLADGSRTDTVIGLQTRVTAVDAEIGLVRSLPIRSYQTQAEFLTERSTGKALKLQLLLLHFPEMHSKVRAPTAVDDTVAAVRAAAQMR